MEKEKKKSSIKVLFFIILASIIAIVVFWGTLIFIISSTSNQKDIDILANELKTTSFEKQYGEIEKIFRVKEKFEINDNYFESDYIVYTIKGNVVLINVRIELSKNDSYLMIVKKEEEIIFKGIVNII